MKLEEVKKTAGYIYIKSKRKIKKKLLIRIAKNDIKKY